MACLGCPCGNRMSNVSVPNNIEGIIHNCWEDEFTYGNGIDFWECKDCGRLGVELPSKIKWYVPEDGEPGDLI
jgi:hypothetical protein